MVKLLNKISFYVILIVVCVLIMVVCFYKTYQQTSYKRQLPTICTETCEAKVLTSKRSRQASGMRSRGRRGSRVVYSTFYDVTLELTIDSKPYNMKDQTTSPLRVGETIEVHYNPADPTQGYVGDSPSMNTYTYMHYSSIASFVLILAIFAIARIKQNGDVFAPMKTKRRYDEDYDFTKYE